MPELPEIETIMRGIAPSLIDKIFLEVNVKQPKLRWEIPKNLSKEIVKQRIIDITRRGKYLLINTTNGTLIIHLGMSGRLLLQPKEHTFAKHEHVNLIFNNGLALCYIDPRRFGTILWTKDPNNHALLKDLGPEPLTDDFSGKYLFQKAKSHKCSIKQFIMNNKVVVGVGNIYAAEALFSSKIHPNTAAKSMTEKQYILLAKNIKKILLQAIKNNGTTFRDYATSEGKSGNFQNELNVYGRAKLPCKICKTTLEEVRLGQRSTVFCPKCQK